MRRRCWMINIYHGWRRDQYMCHALPNHAQHVNTHLIISHWVFRLMGSLWTWVGPTPATWYLSAYSNVWEKQRWGGGTKRKRNRKKCLRKRLTFTEARMQLNFCGRILCILLPEAKKGSKAGCSAKRGSRKKKDMCVLGWKAKLISWPSSPQTSEQKPYYCTAFSPFMSRNVHFWII